MKILNPRDWAAFERQAKDLFAGRDAIREQTRICVSPLLFRGQAAEQCRAEGGGGARPLGSFEGGHHLVGHDVKRALDLIAREEAAGVQLGRDPAQV
jgi:hypothetical protein